MFKNPCGEIPIGKPEPVTPWVQAQWMQNLRIKGGLKPYTQEEIDKIIESLEKQYNCYWSN